MRIGSLFAGVGGLDLGLSMILDAEPAWFVEFDKHPSAILAHHWPDVPNYGDVTAVDWDTVPPVDILTGGYPCQPFSHAGTRKGTNDERHLWPYFADAIRVLRPRLVVLENVAGHLTLGFDAVLADLAALGFDAEWGVVSASDAGAPHRRQRLFVIAWDAERSPEDALAEGGGSRHPVGESGDDAAADAERQGLQGQPVGGMGGAGFAAESSGTTDGLTLLPTPAARDHKDQYVDNAGSHRPGDTDSVPRAVREIVASQHEGDSDAASVCEARPGEVLPNLRGADVPEAVQRSTGGYGEVPQPQDVQPVMRQHQADGEEGHAALAGTEAPEAELRDVRNDERPARSPHRPRPGEQRPDQPDDAVLVVSPETALAGGSRQADAGRSQGYCDGCSQWGPYAAAIHRWEIRLGRLAPPPTEPGKDGRHRLSPRAVEFMMGLPDGHVTGVGIPRNAQLKALGNGVVPQQAALALSMLLPRLGAEVAA